MMGHRQVDQVALFYEFSLERHVPTDHLLRSIDRFVELGELRRELAGFYSTMGRPSIEMLIVGYSLGIRSERRLCEEVHLNLAYRWFCRLGLDGHVPDHSTQQSNLVHLPMSHHDSQSCFSQRLNQRTSGVATEDFFNKIGQ